NPKPEPCELPHIYIHENDFDNIKRIFDYSEDYSNYRLHLIGHYPPCNSDYKSYLDTYVETYKKLRDECPSKEQLTGYCKEFHNYFHGKDDDLLSTWKCDLKIDDPRDKEFEEEEEEVEDDGEAATQIEKSSPTFGIGAQGLSFIHRHSSEGAIHTAVPDLPVSSLLPGAVSVAGIFVPFYLMYNYTYAGTWINKVLGRKTRTNFNPYTDQYLMANFSGLENFNSERSRYNIAYSPE
ncbi:PIR protein, partial [Plasmodium vivax]